MDCLNEYFLSFHCSLLKVRSIKVTKKLDMDLIVYIASDYRIGLKYFF